MRQSLVSQAFGLLLMVAVYVTEFGTPTVDRSVLNHWALMGGLNMAVRAVLFYKVFTPLPVEMAKSIWLRLLPLSIVLIGAGQWIWTIQLFIGHEQSLTAFVLFAGFLAISIAVMGMWPTVPIAVILYLGTTWPPFFLRLYQVGWVPGPVMLVLTLGVVAVIWACVYLEISQVQPILNRSDEVELLLAKLRDTNGELNRANGELDAMRRDAASALETRSMFFSSATHDFKQRLHAMKLLAHSAIDDTGTDSMAYSRLRRLTDAVEDVEYYITDVLDFAKLEGGPLSPDKRVGTLQAIFHELDLNFEEVAKARKVALTFRATDVVLRTEPAMLQRILENLVSNAVKFTTGRVVVAARHRAGGIAIEVWDQGGGIPTELQSQIFFPFFQAPTAAIEMPGVGLGLAVVKRLADTLGYQLQVRSRVGRGSVMTVLVPASDLQV